MARAFAIGLGAGTQVFTLGFGQALVGSGELVRAWLMGGAWAANLAVAEWSIRRRTRGRVARKPVTAVVAG